MAKDKIQAEELDVQAVEVTETEVAETTTDVVDGATVGVSATGCLNGTVFPVAMLGTACCVYPGLFHAG